MPYSGGAPEHLSHFVCRGIEWRLVAAVAVEGPDGTRFLCQPAIAGSGGLMRTDLVAVNRSLPIWRMCAVWRGSAGWLRRTRSPPGAGRAVGVRGRRRA